MRGFRRGLLYYGHGNLRTALKQRVFLTDEAAVQFSARTKFVQDPGSGCIYYGKPVSLAIMHTIMQVGMPSSLLLARALQTFLHDAG
jgi:hypothetical protein